MTVHSVVIACGNNSPLMSATSRTSTNTRSNNSTKAEIRSEIGYSLLPKTKIGIHEVNLTPKNDQSRITDYFQNKSPRRFEEAAWRTMPINFNFPGDRRNSVNQEQTTKISATIGLYSLRMRHVICITDPEGCANLIHVDPLICNWWKVPANEIFRKSVLRPTLKCTCLQQLPFTFVLAFLALTSRLALCKTGCTYLITANLQWSDHKVNSSGRNKECCTPFLYGTRFKSTWCLGCSQQRNSNVLQSNKTDLKILVKAIKSEPKVTTAIIQMVLNAICDKSTFISSQVNSPIEVGTHEHFGKTEACMTAYEIMDDDLIRSFNNNTAGFAKVHVPLPKH